MNRPSPTLSQYVARMATNLLASGLVLILTLVIGRQMLQWWREARRAPQASLAGAAVPADAWNDVRIWFGEADRPIRRLDLAGDREAVGRQLRAACLETSGRTTSGPSKVEVTELLKPVPLLVLSDPAAADDAARHVCWGVALPQSGRDGWWSGFVWTRAAESPAQPTLPLPAGCARIATLRTGSGTVTAFRSQLPADELRRRWDELVSPAPLNHDAWQISGAGSARHYDSAAGSWDIHFAPAAHDEVLGVCLQREMRAPAATNRRTE